MISNRTGKDPVIPYLNPLSDPSPAGGSRLSRLRATDRSNRANPASLQTCAVDAQLTAARVRSTNPALAELRRLLFRLQAAARLFTARRRPLATALLAATAILTATVKVTTANHFETPETPLAPPVALLHVPTPVQAIASAGPNRKHNRFVEALHLNRLGDELSGLHPIRTIERPIGALSQPLTALSKPLAALTNPLRGIATWYGNVLQGHKTASGETFDDRELTAAHKTLPLGTVVRVTDLRSRRSVVVRINDRGTLAPGRVIDLSSAAAEQLGILRAGIADVKLEVLHKPHQDDDDPDQG